MSRHRSAPDSVIVGDRSPADRIAILRQDRRRPGWVPGDGPDLRGWNVRAPEALAAGLLDADPAGGADPEYDDEAAPSGRARRLRPGPRWHRLAETWVPEPLRDARIDPGRRGALVLSLVAALAAVAAAIGVWRDRPQPRPVQPVASAPLADVASSGDGSTTASGTGDGTGTAATVVAAPASATGSAHPPTSAGPAVIAVSVTGLVRKPGLVHLPAGSRVADAVAASGGVADDGSVTGLNLAAPLSDGDSVVVGAAATSPPTAAGPQAGARAGGAAAEADGAEPTAAAPIDLNTADADTLETLPGVGPVMAGNILAWRQENGSFSSIEQLQEVSGIGPSRFAQLQPLVSIG